MQKKIVLDYVYKEVKNVMIFASLELHQNPFVK